MHALWTAALDLRLGEHDSLVLVTRRPERWDELLDTRLPLLISSEVGSWEEICGQLHEAGCSDRLPARLVHRDGRVEPLRWHGRLLKPAPGHAAPEPGAGKAAAEAESGDPSPEPGPGHPSAQREPGPCLREASGVAAWTLCLGWSHPDQGWRARLPLWGRRYLVTRAAEQGRALVERLEALGATARAVPTIAFSDPDSLQPWQAAVQRIGEFDWVLFTSPNGVDFFLQRLLAAGLDLRSLGRARLACIGPSTARALARHSLKADLVPQEFVAEGLLAALGQALGEDLRGLRCLLPRAQVARTVLPDALRAAGAEVLVAPVYKTVAPELAGLPESAAGGQPPRLLFTSSSTVDNWVSAIEQKAEPGSWPCFCIGPVTAQTAREHGLTVLGVAAEYTVEGLVALLLEHDSRVAAG
jgi:uroporphyrinogen-III synthase